MLLTNRYSSAGYHIWIIAAIGISILMGSCRAGKRVAYFQNVPDSLSTPMVVDEAPYTVQTVQPDDILQISIQTIDQKSADMIAGSSVAAAGASAAAGTYTNSQNIPSYLVDANGYIEAPLVGKIKVGGLTTTEVRNLLHEKASIYYKDPIINVRFSNFTVTILGDVSKPGRFVLPNEKITVIDAIGIAGDLAISGRRENIMIIREEGGKKIIARYDLNSTDIFRSPYYYLKQGDLVYVQPNKAKSKSSTYDPTTDRYLSYILAGLSVLITLATIFKF
ncbi:MAG: polysaccharide biosynthesis/export family protein [Taibaiella sp.]|nr:polysaccharide biosynthesis/export family protein [Taibaiella sp.]